MTGLEGTKKGSLDEVVEVKAGAVAKGSTTPLVLALGPKLVLRTLLAVVAEVSESKTGLAGGTLLATEVESKTRPSKRSLFLLAVLDLLYAPACTAGKELPPMD